MKRKRLIPVLLAAMLLLAAIPVGMSVASAAEAPRLSSAVPVNRENMSAASAPKYVFLFIGDGMTYPQFQTASAYLSINEDKDTILTTNELLNFMRFPVAGSATTYDSTSFCPDSA